MMYNADILSLRERKPSNYNHVNRLFRKRRESNYENFVFREIYIYLGIYLFFK